MNQRKFVLPHDEAPVVGQGVMYPLCARIAARRTVLILLTPLSKTACRASSGARCRSPERQANQDSENFDIAGRTEWTSKMAHSRNPRQPAPLGWFA